MRDLSILLWCDLSSDEERIEFIESGRAYDTGIIASALVDDFVNALKCRIAIRECLEIANNSQSEWGNRAEMAFQVLEDAVSS